MAPGYIIWIEAEMWAAGEWNPVDDSSSVNVTILVDEVSRQRIEEVVAHLIETGEFSSAFERLPPSDADEAT